MNKEKDEAEVSVLMAACIGFDGRSRLRGAVRGDSERFHAIREGSRRFACDSMNNVPGTPQPAQSVPVELRCRRAACASIFTRADAATAAAAQSSGGGSTAQGAK